MKYSPLHSTPAINYASPALESACNYLLHFKRSSSAQSAPLVTPRCPPISSSSLIADVMRLICWSLRVNALTSAAQQQQPVSHAGRGGEDEQSLWSSGPGCVILQGRVHVWHLLSARFDLTPLRARWELFPCAEGIFLFFFSVASL